MLKWFAYGNHDRGYFNSRDFTAEELAQGLEKNHVHILEDESATVGDLCIVGSGSCCIGPHPRGTALPARPDLGLAGDQRRSLWEESPPRHFVAQQSWERHASREARNVTRQVAHRDARRDPPLGKGGEIHWLLPAVNFLRGRRQTHEGHCSPLRNT